MPTFTGLRERTRGEKAHDDACAQDQLDMIELAERDLIALVARWRDSWQGEVEMDLGALRALGDLLSDVFVQARHDACEELCLDATDLWDRDAAVEALATGARR